MAGFLYRGILLQQHKEPALSRDLREFFNADTIGIQMDRPPVENPDQLTADEICEIAREAKIFDERDGKPLVDKLLRARARRLHLLVGDAIDDEPYISSQLNPLLKNQELAAQGLAFVQRAVGAPKACFAVYRNLTDLEIRIPKTIGAFQVRRIHGRYPAEYQASKFFGSERGVLEIGVGAILHLARAILFNKPQTTTFVTVAGDCIGNPTNLEVSLGMTVTQTLERCGLIDDPVRVVVGGSMTGFSVIDTDKTLVTPSTRAILAFRAKIGETNYSCIGCSRCVHACPEGLNPFFLYRSIRKRRYRDFRTLDAQMCIGCGSCSYVCPAKLDLAGTIQRGHSEMRRMSGSIRLGNVLERKQADADYQSYYQDYLLYQEGKAQKRDLSRLEKERAANERAAQQTRQMAEKQANAELEAANRTAQADLDSALKAGADRFAQEERAAQQELDAVKAVKAQADAQLEKARLAAQQAEETARKAAERAGQAAVKASSLAAEAQQKADAQKTAEAALQPLREASSKTAEAVQQAEQAQAALSGDSAGDAFQNAKNAAKAASQTAKFAAKNLEEAEKAAAKAASGALKADEKAAAAQADAQQQKQNAESLALQAQQAVRAIDSAAETVAAQERAVAAAEQVCAGKIRDAQQMREQADAAARKAFEQACGAAQQSYETAMQSAADTYQGAYEALAAQYQTGIAALAARLAQAQADNAAAHEQAERAAAIRVGREYQSARETVNTGEETQ